MINHKDSPGLSDDIVVAAGMPPGSGRGLFEAPFAKCHCCQTMLIINPLRTRERGYCPIHDKYACDWCHEKRITTGVCKSFDEIADEFIENEIKKTLIKEI